MPIAQLTWAAQCNPTRPAPVLLLSLSLALVIGHSVSLWSFGCSRTQKRFVSPSESSTRPIVGLLFHLMFSMEFFHGPLNTGETAVLCHLSWSRACCPQKGPLTGLSFPWVSFRLLFSILNLSLESCILLKIHLFCYGTNKAGAAGARLKVTV